MAICRSLIVLIASRMPLRQQSIDSRRFSILNKSTSRHIWFVDSSTSWRISYAFCTEFTYWAWSNCVIVLAFRDLGLEWLFCEPPTRVWSTHTTVRFRPGSSSYSRPSFVTSCVSFLWLEDAFEGVLTVGTGEFTRDATTGNNAERGLNPSSRSRCSKMINKSSFDPVVANSDVSVFALLL